MNTTQQPDFGKLIKNYIEEIKAERKAIIEEYEQEISKLESIKKEKLKENDSKLNEIRKEIESLTSGKPARKQNKRMSDSEISEAIKNIFTSNSLSIKTDEMLEKIGIQRPRFDKYTKSPESIIKYEKNGKAFLWSLK